MELLIFVAIVVLGAVLCIDASIGEPFGRGHWLAFAGTMLGIGWISLMLLTPKAVAMEEVFPLHTIESHGEVYQVYVDENGTSFNITDRYGRVFPEGSVVKIEHLENWHWGCYCLGMQNRKILVPTEDPEDEDGLVEFTERNDQ